MMNDWRDQPFTHENENRFSVNMIAAAVVALGFLVIGTFAYETGGARPQSMQAVASNPFTPPPAPTSAPTGPVSPSDLTSAEPPATTAEPLKNAEADTPAVTAPASQATEKPVQSAEVATPAKPRATEKLVKVSRAQRKAPAAPEVEPVQFSAPAPEPQPAQAAPVEAAPVQAAPAEVAPAVSEHVDAAPQEVPMPAAAADAPQQNPPATDSGQAGTEAAPQ